VHNPELSEESSSMSDPASKMMREGAKLGREREGQTAALAAA